MILTPKQTNQFLRDARKAGKRGKNLAKLETAVRLIAEREALPARYRDHALTGNWKGHRECHIEPDWLLVYRLEENNLILERTGSHSDLF